MTTPDPTALSDAFLRDTAVAPALLKMWEERRYQPVVFDTASASLGAGSFVREVECLGATQLLVHGVHDADGRALTLFTFACRPGGVGSRQIYLAQLLAPALHAAWVRTQLQRTPSAVERASSHGVLTGREQDILKWISFGKSNRDRRDSQDQPAHGEEPRAEDSAQAERREPHARDRQGARVGS
jgi:hypothetical protein